MKFIRLIFDIARDLRNSRVKLRENPTEKARQLIKEGNSLEDAGRAESALESYAQAIRIAPSLASAHLNYGNALNALGDLEPALKAYGEALKCDPTLAGAHFNIGNTLAASNRYRAALTAYQKAIHLNPNFTEAKLARAVVLHDLKDFDAAVAAYREILNSAPDHAEVHGNLGSVLNDQGRLDEAIACYRRALEIKPDDPLIRSALLFAQNYLSNQPGDILLTDARRYGELVTLKARPFTSWPERTEAERVLRVGMISGDFCRHPVGYFTENVVSAIARRSPRRIELHGYASHLKEDALTQRLRVNCAGWKSIAGIPDERAAEIIHNDRIDILIDLSGHTAHNRLPIFAWNPSPVQVTWLGYFATTGLTQIDYLIADEWSLPASEENNFVETIWRLPSTRLCFTPPEEAVPVSDLPALANGYITFGCFNHLGKINDNVVALWARVLQNVPGSRLFLKSPPLAEKAVRESVTDRFGRHGIESGRLIFEGISIRKTYLEAYWRVDIALDPFPYPGGATSVEALWMGVPVLSMAGSRFLARQGSGILNAVGLTDWIAEDADDYVRRASRHASEVGPLALLRKDLRRKALASPLFDADQFAAHFETAIVEIWRARSEESRLTEPGTTHAVAPD